MRNVSVRGIVRLGILVTTVLAMQLAPARAQSTNGGREIKVSVLGTSNRFSQPMHTVADLRAMANTNRNQIEHVLTMAGLTNVSAQVIDALIAGNVTDTTVAPGSEIKWMAIKRAGRPAILQNVRWTGRQSFEAWQFTVTASGMNYNFVVPKICGNLSLLSAVAAPQPRITQAPPPPPPPPAAPQPPTVVIIEPPPPPAPAPAPAPVVAPTTVSNNRRPWIATGFVGTSMDMNLGVNPLGTVLTTEDERDVSGSLAVGGQIAYVRRYLGAEFTADFSPDANIFNAFLADEPHINSFMGNVIGSVPFRDGQFRPYITAGLGAVMMHTRVFTSADITNLDTVTSTVSRFGSNIGAGLWIFSGGNLGVRADFRHYTTRATSNPDLLLENPGSASDITRALVSGLNFWRTDVGVSLRW
jgi:hypothetical protein